MNPLTELPAPLVGPAPDRQSRYQWRGIMLDCARTCHRVESIKKVLQLAHRYGFNRFHWHLTDDQGWRFEVPGYPLLTAIGANLERDEFRNYHSLWEDTRERAIAQSPERWTNGYYADEEIAEIVALADELGIEIIPEFDFPGHMAAAIAAYPQIGRPTELQLPTGSMREHMYWPAANDLLWPNQDALDLIAAALTRLLELFPGRYIHIGGDECAYQQWESDPALKILMRERGWEHPNQLQGWFMNYGIEIIRSHGRIPVVWDDIRTQLDSDVLVTAWGQDCGLNDLNEYQQKYVFTDARTLYLNRVDPDAEGTQKGMVPAVSIDDILRAEWGQPTDGNCVGVEACLWSEFVLDHHDVMHMLMPRLLAVAARMWFPQEPAEAIAPNAQIGEAAATGLAPSPQLDEAAVAQMRQAVMDEYKIVRPYLEI